MRRFVLPDLGEGLTESELVAWRVAVGDRVELNQIIAEVETAKALVELPAPAAGIVSRLYAEPGATVLVGEALVDIATGEEADEPAVAPEDGAAGERDHAGQTTATREPVLVGYGPRVEDGSRPKRRDRIQSVGDAFADPAGHAATRPRSTPPVRRLARDLGVVLDDLVGTGVGGRITREDVEARAAVGDRPHDGTPAQGPTTIGGEPAQEAVPNRSVDGTIRRPISGVRRRTAAAMVASAFTAPHVTEFLTVDVTPTMTFIDQVSASPRGRAHRINILTVLSKAACIAARHTPSVNARWDEDAQEIIEFGGVNLGIAAATGRGLLVPNISGADRLDLFGLADAIDGLVASARDGKTAPAELAGGTMTITNIGVFGIDAGTPILNPGESAILALGAVRRLPWEFEGGIALRQVVTLALSFDHRVVDGAEGSRFLADVGQMLADPAAVLTFV